MTVGLGSSELTGRSPGGSVVGLWVFICTASGCWGRRERFAVLLRGRSGLATELFIPWTGISSAGLSFFFFLSNLTVISM